MGSDDKEMNDICVQEINPHFLYKFNACVHY